MNLKIAFGEFGSEVNSFASGTCDFARLAPDGWRAPETLIEKFGGTSSYLGGMIDTALAAGVELVPLPSIKITATPVLARDTVDQVLEHICSYLKPVKDQLDGICFAVHGAGCAEGIDDLQLATIQAFRRVVGDKMPIMCSADLHGNISQQFINSIQGLFGLKENPHTDYVPTASRAMSTLIATLRGQCHPRTYLQPLPLLTTPAAGSTLASPMLDIKEHFAAYCKKHGLIDATFFHGFSATDIPNSRASVVVITDGSDPAPYAKELARYVWSLREQMIPISLTPDEAIDRALSLVKDGYAVVHEVSDNVGSGCPGDGTHTLRALLKRDIPHSIFTYIYDPEVAEQAHRAGVGAKISIRLGGKTDKSCGEPIELDDVEVLATPAATGIPYTTPMHRGLICEYGKTARLRHGNVEFIVESVRRQCLDDSAITMTGADIKDYKLVFLKSINHFRSFFTDRADAIVPSDPPGLRGDVRNYSYQRIHRPIFPLDMDVEFDI